MKQTFLNDSEIKIYYFKRTGFLSLTGSIFLILFGSLSIYYGIDSGILLIIIGIATGIAFIKDLVNKKQWLTINNEGVIYKDDSLIKWEQIEHTAIERIGYKDYKDYLVIKLRDEKVYILLEELKIEQRKLVELMSLYSGQSKNNK